MKATTILILCAVAVSACGEEPSTATTGNGGAGSAAEKFSEMRASTASAPAAVTGRAFGIAGATPLTRTVASDTRSDESNSPSASADDPLQKVNASLSATTMLIRTGQAFVEAEKVDPAILKIRQLAAQVGGYITNSSVSGGRDQIRQATLEVKVPTAKYDEAVSSLSTIGKVETVNSQAQDVGEEYVDVTARVANARRLEERLISLLANRTGKLDEVLRVEAELARVREEIERYEGRLRYLGARVATSTLTITVHEPAPLIGNTPGENPIASAVRRAWRNSVALLALAIASLGVVIPLGLVGLAGWMVYRRWRKIRLATA